MVRFAVTGLGLSVLALLALNRAPADPPAAAAAARVERGIPMQLNHQGVVLVAGERFNGNGYFRFALVDSSTGINAWTNDGTHVGTTGRPDAAVGLVVINGIYNVGLGDTSQAVMVPLTTSAFNLDNLVLRIWFDDGVSGLQLLSPDQKLATAPYAFRAVQADTAVGVVPVGAIVAWTNHLAGTPALPETFVQCNGQVLTDPQSPLNGQTIPNLNNAPSGYFGGRFLRGGATSGICQDATEVNIEGEWYPGASPPGLDVYERDGDGRVLQYDSRYQKFFNQSYAMNTARMRPVNMSVIWVIRVK